MAITFDAYLEADKDGRVFMGPNDGRKDALCGVFTVALAIDGSHPLRTHLVDLIKHAIALDIEIGCVDIAVAKAAYAESLRKVIAEVEELDF